MTVYCTKTLNFLILELLPFVIFILNFCVEHMSVTTKISAWNFTGRYPLMRGSILHKKHNPPLPNFLVIAVCFLYLTYGLVHIHLSLNFFTSHKSTKPMHLLVNTMFQERQLLKNRFCKSNFTATVNIFG